MVRQPPYAVTEEQRELLRQRYGPARRRPAWLVPVVVAVSVLFVGWVVWAAAAQQSATSIRWRTVGFQDLTQQSVVVNYDVFKNRDEQVVCVLRAFDTEGRLVGLAQVAVRSPGSDLYQTSRLAVVRPASAAEVQSCAALP